jgi:hypothetical protein
LDEFLIRSTDGSGGLMFYDRSPVDRTKSMESFSLRVTDHNLSAAGQVYADYVPRNPALLFADMAEHWSGWRDELVWKSLEGELAMRCSHDGLGHIAIRIELLSGPRPDDWRIAATVMTEAGQLERIAQQAVVFFGEPYL